MTFNGVHDDTENTTNKSWTSESVMFLSSGVGGMLWPTALGGKDWEITAFTSFFLLQRTRNAKFPLYRFISNIRLVSCFNHV